MTQITLTLPDETEKLLRAIVREEVSSSIRSLKPQSSEDEKLFSRADVANLCNVSLVTIHAWMKRGVITPYKLNGKTYFKRSEVFKSLKKI